MAAVGVSEASMLAALKELSIDDVDIAAVNSDSNITLSGPPASVKAVGVWAKAQKVLFMLLPIPRAYHSRYVLGLRDAFYADLEGFEPKSVRDGCVFVSTVTGAVAAAPLDADYWWSNVRGTVQFSRGMRALEAYADVVVDIGPHAVLSSYIADCTPTLTYVPSLRRSRNPTVDDVQELLRSLAALFAHGVAVDWAAVQAPSIAALPRLRLPAPLWRHGVALRHGKFLRALGAQAEKPVSSPEPGPRVKNMTVHSNDDNGATLDPAKHAYIRDHQVNGATVVPGAYFVCAALALSGAPPGCNAVTGTISSASGLSLTAADVSFERFLEWTAPSKPLELARLFDGRAFTFQQNAVSLCRGFVTTRHLPPPLEPAGLQTAQKACAHTAIDMDAVYRALATHSGIKFGPSFRRLRRVHGGDGHYVAEVAPAVSMAALHPTFVDACFQLLGVAMGLHTSPCVPSKLGTFVVSSIDDFAALHDVPFALHLCVTRASEAAWSADVDVYAAERLVASVRDLTLTVLRTSLPSDLTVLTVHEQTLSLVDIPTPACSGTTAEAVLNELVNVLAPVRVLNVLLDGDMNLSSEVRLSLACASLTI